MVTAGRADRVALVGPAVGEHLLAQRESFGIGGVDQLERRHVIRVAGLLAAVAVEHVEAVGRAVVGVVAEDAEVPAVALVDGEYGDDEEVPLAVADLYRAHSSQSTVSDLGHLAHHITRCERRWKVSFAPVVRRAVPEPVLRDALALALRERLAVTHETSFLWDRSLNQAQWYASTPGVNPQELEPCANSGFRFLRGRHMALIPAALR